MSYSLSDEQTDVENTSGLQRTRSPGKRAPKGGGGIGRETQTRVVGEVLYAMGGIRGAGGAYGTRNGRVNIVLIFPGTLMVGLLLLIVWHLTKTGQTHLDAPRARIILSEICRFRALD